MPVLRRVLRSQQVGLVLIILALTAALTLLAGSHVDQATGRTINNFFNSHTLIQTATDASFVAIMAVGATLVIISGGIDLSVGSVYALAGVTMGLLLRAAPGVGGPGAVALALVVSMAVGLGAGALNGVMVVGLGVHPFIITLGTMWILRGIAFVASKAESILLPESLTRFAKSPLGLGARALPGADADHAARERARRRLPRTHGHGAARLRGGRQRGGQSFLGPPPGPDPDRRLRRSPGSAPASPPSSGPASTGRSLVETRPDMSYT